MLVASPRRQTLAEKGLPHLGPARVSHSLSTSACILSFLFSLLAFDLGSALSPSWHPDPSLVGSEEVDTSIKDIATDAVAEVEKITAEEGTAKGPAEEPGKGTAGEAGKAAAEEVAFDDLPSSSAASGSGRYLRISDDLFVRLLGASSTRAPFEGEVFDEEALAAAGLEVVDEPDVSCAGSQEERLLQAMGASFRKLQALHRARLDKAKSRAAVMEKAEEDFGGRVAKAQDWFR